MKKTAIVCSAFLIFVCNTYAQDSAKTNPIIFGDMVIGGTVAGLHGLLIGVSANYQIKHSFVTIKATHTTDPEPVILSPVLPLPYFINHEHTDEYGLLYGYRYIKNGFSFSFSAGVSYNDHAVNYYDRYNSLTATANNQYAGIPFEADVRWFKRRKERYRIFYFFPIGDSTGFGKSFGFKLSGNISKYSYLAVGIVGGLGFHKHY